MVSFAVVGSERDSDLPQRLGRYQVIRRLGTGGMAEVFLARARGAEGIDKLLVLKRVLPTFARNPKFIAMFTAEAQVAVRLNHPNIVQVYAFEQMRDQFLLAMEYVDGLDLGRLVSSSRRQGKRLPHALAAYVCMEVAKGLDYAHKRQDEEGRLLEIVHRDVSPQNILLSHEGVVKVADFGIAKARLVSEETGVIKGKFAYMSPEQASGRPVDRRSDVYSLGVVLAEMLMHRPMHQGYQGLEVLERVREGLLTWPAEVDPSVPHELDTIVRRALAFDPEDRFQSARSMASELARYLHGLEEPVESEALERFIEQVAPRPRSQSASIRISTVPTLQTEVAGRSEHREPRQVVVVSGVFQDDLAEASPEEAAIGKRARDMLREMAFKGSALLRWPEGEGGRVFRLVVGATTPSVQDPLRAVSLAFDVKEAFEGLSADLLHSPRIALGVARGRVAVVRRARGQPTLEPLDSVFRVADQLARHAPPSEVLVTGEVRRMVRRHYAFHEERSLEVPVQEGSGERSVRAHRLRGARTRAERTADALGALRAGGIVGREEHIQELLDAYRHAIESSRTHHVLVIGELGVGKSTLVAAAIEAMEPPPRLLHVECTFATRDAPYAACVALVREAARIPEEADEEQSRNLLRDAVARWFPEEGSRREEVRQGLERLLLPARGEQSRRGDEVERERQVTRALERMLLAVARDGPTVVWVDDLQWIDNPSLGFVRSVAQRPFEVPVLAIFSGQPESAVEKALSTVPRIQLGELPPQARAELVRRAFARAFPGAIPSEALQRLVLDKAGGNPFFVGELVEALLERGAVRIEPSGEGDGSRIELSGTASPTLPTTLEGVVGARLAALPPEQSEALQWLAVADPGFPIDSLEELAERELRDAVEELTRRGLLSRDEEGRVDFSTSLVRQVAYQQIDPQRRRRMHRRVARLLSREEERLAAPARVAAHWKQAGDRLRAAEAYLRAAEAARHVHSNQEALRFYGEALRLLPANDPQRFETLAQREEILRGLGRDAGLRERELRAMLQAAEACGLAEHLALAHARWARWALDQADAARAADHLPRALSAAREADEISLQVEVLRLMAELEQLRGHPEQALQHGEEALRLVGTSRMRLAERGAVLLQQASLLRLLGQADESVAAIVEALVVFRRLGRKREESLALNRLGIALAARGDYEDALALFRASIRIDRDIGDRFHLARKLSNVAQLYAELGEADRALTFARRAERVLQTFEDPQARADVLCALAEQLVEHGHLEEAAGHLDRARRCAEATGDPYDLARERLVRAALERARGDMPRMAEAAEEAVEEARRGGVLAFELQGLALQAEALARLGMPERAERRLQEVMARLQRGQHLEQAERVYGALGRASAALAGRPAAEEARRLAAARLRARAERLSTESVRTRYLERPLLRGALEGAGPEQA